MGVDRGDAAQVRSASYRLLSRMFLEEIPLAFLEALSGAEHDGFLEGSGFAPAFRGSLAKVLADAVERTGAQQAFLDAASECAALLWGMSAYAVHPYESVYASPAGVMMQEPRDRVVSAYRQAGVAVSKGGANIPEDHIGIELAFMSLLCVREARAIAAGDDDLACGARIMQRAFLRDHLSSWALAFCDDLLECSGRWSRDNGGNNSYGVSVYGSLAHTTKRFIESDGHVLGGL